MMMRNRTGNRRHTTATMAVSMAVAAAAMTAGCSSTPGRTGTTPPAHGAAAPASPSSSTRGKPSQAPTVSPAITPHDGVPDPAGIDQHDATAVSRTAVTLMWSMDTATDADSTGNVYRRAAPYLTAQLAAQLTNSPAHPPPPAAWTQHSAYGHVELQSLPVVDVGPDTPTLAHRLWRITVTPTGRDGWRGTPFTTDAFITLTRLSPASPWRVSDLTVS